MTTTGYRRHHPAGNLRQADLDRRDAARNLAAGPAGAGTVPAAQGPLPLPAMRPQPARPGRGALQGVRAPAEHPGRGARRVLASGDRSDHTYSLASHADSGAITPLLGGSHACQSSTAPVTALIGTGVFFTGVSFASTLSYGAIVGIETLGISNASYALLLMVVSLVGAATSVTLGLRLRPGARPPRAVLGCALMGALGFGAHLLLPHAARLHHRDRGDRALRLDHLFAVVFLRAQLLQRAPHRPRRVHDVDAADAVLDRLGGRAAGRRMDRGDDDGVRCLRHRRRSPTSSSRSSIAS